MAASQRLQIGERFVRIEPCYSLLTKEKNARKLGHENCVIFDFISPDISEADFHERLSKFGKIIKMKLTAHFGNNGATRKEGMVRFENDKAARAAVLSLTGSGWGGPNMICQILPSKEEFDRNQPSDFINQNDLIHTDHRMPTAPPQGMLCYQPVFIPFYPPVYDNLHRFAQ